MEWLVSMRCMRGLVFVGFAALVDEVVARNAVEEEMDHRRERLFEPGKVTVEAVR